MNAFWSLEITSVRHFGAILQQCESEMAWFKWRCAFELWARIAKSSGDTDYEQRVSDYGRLDILGTCWLNC